MKGTCGIILVEEDVTGDPKAYLGVVSGHDEKADTGSIVAWGMKFSLDTVHRIAHHLEAKKGRK